MNPIISELLPGGAKALKDIKRRKTPMLITQNGRPAAYLMDVTTYERLEKRMRILEGIARGETAILEGLTLSHSEAKNEAMARLIWTEPALQDLDAIADLIPAF